MLRKVKTPQGSVEKLADGSVILTGCVGKLCQLLQMGSRLMSLQNLGAPFVYLGQSIFRMR